MAKVLLVDDLPDVRRLLAVALEREGHQVEEAGDGRRALATFDASPDIDLVLLDIEVPGMNGLEVLRCLRERSDVPVILVTGRGDEPDRIVGLRLGAEDYVAKPFSIGELMARVSAVLRRCPRRRPNSDTELEPTPEPAASTLDPEVTIGSITLRLRRREVEVRGEPVQLTHREFELLEHLASAPLAVFSRDELLRDIWHSKPEWQDPATVTEHVRRLRHKLEADPSRPCLIQTVRGAGYRLVPTAA